MPEVGVRELRTRTAEILRDVREHQTRYTVTYRGRAVGLLVPLTEQPADAPSERKAWDEFFRLGDVLMQRGWRSPLTAAELLSEMRR